MITNEKKTSENSEQKKFNIIHFNEFQSYFGIKADKKYKNCECF